MSCLSRVHYRGDRRPYLKLKLVYRDANGNPAPVDLSTAGSVTFSMSKAGKDGVALFTSPMTVLDAANGIVTYLWQATDLATVGQFKGWVTINWTGAERETKGDLSITVKERPAWA